MDELERRLLTHLRRDGRASVSELAQLLGVTRTTVRNRMAALQDRGDVVGYTVVTRQDVAQSPVRGLMMLAIEGRGAEKIRRQLGTMPQVMAVHSTNGKWDMIAEIGTETLEELDQTLFSIRRLDGVSQSETSLLLSTRKGRA